MGLVGTAEPERNFTLPIRGQGALNQLKAQHLNQNLFGSRSIRAIQQAVIHTNRGDAFFGVGIPGCRIQLSAVVAHPRLVGVQFDQMTSR